jgi:hypothetical protein
MRGQEQEWRLEAVSLASSPWILAPVEAPGADHFFSSVHLLSATVVKACSPGTVATSL